MSGMRCSGSSIFPFAKRKKYKGKHHADQHRFKDLWFRQHVPITRRMLFVQIFRAGRRLKTASKSKILWSWQAYSTKQNFALTVYERTSTHKKWYWEWTFIVDLQETMYTCINGRSSWYLKVLVDEQFGRVEAQVPAPPLWSCGVVMGTRKFGRDYLILKHHSQGLKDINFFCVKLEKVSKIIMINYNI